MKIFGNNHYKKARNEHLQKNKKKRILTIALCSVMSIFVLLGGLVLLAPEFFMEKPTHVDPDKYVRDPDTQGGIMGASAIGVPEEEAPIDLSGDRKDDYFVFLLACTDDAARLTDAILVAAYDVEAGTLNVLNVPRDTKSNVKRTGAAQKINAAYSVGGEDQLIRELHLLLGIPIDRFVLFSFEGVAAVVDAIGGVEYEIPFRMKYDDPVQNLHINFQSGLQKLNGEEAVEFMRWRKNNPGVGGGYVEGDIGRIKTQQNFMMAIAKQTISLGNVLKIDAISKALFEHAETDFTTKELLWFGYEALRMDTENIRFHTLPHTLQNTGASFVIPEKKGILELVNTYFNPYLDEVKEISVVSRVQSSSGSSSGSSGSGSGGSTEPKNPDAQGDDPGNTPDPNETPPGIGDPDGGGTSDPKTPTDPGTSDPETPTDPGTSDPGTPTDPGTSDPGTPTDPPPPVDPTQPPEGIGDLFN